MGKTRWLGRLQWSEWKNQPLLIDGAHNPAAAQALRQYVDTLHQPVTWVMGMLSTKDHQEIFQALLRPLDYLYLVPVPDRSTAGPESLADLARNICPQLGHLQTFPDLWAALDGAIAEKKLVNSKRVTILCGSLYLLGYFLSQLSKS
jgi:dihydrofolate synthase/folylpolyglutamate synthase